ncbi:MAG TPA: portal protein [Vineibacter sp.]|nr:portal protein [Vineibacter sp.]
MESRVSEIISQGNALFEERRPLLGLWQELADQFYPQRADFTVARAPGTEFASHLMTSYPVMCHRDLAAAISNTRPLGAEWFKVGVKDDRLKDDGAVRGWCAYATGVQLRAMYDPVARFTRATKEGDRDFAGFGQCAITVEMNYRAQALLYRSWHLRDVAWREGPEGEIDTVHRDWRPTARNLVREFGRERMAPELLAQLAETPHREVACRHVVLPAADWDWRKKPRNAARFPYVCLYIDVQHQHLIEETPLSTFPWVIPRWETVSGSPYAFSPAAIVSLPDARLLQAQMLVILESGQKAVDPPLVVKHELFRSDINLFAGGLTWADIEADQRLSDVLMPVGASSGAVGTGVELARKVEELLASAWYLNRIFLPAFDPGEKMTAFEVSKRTEEAYRAAVTLFEPVEAEYNARLCEATFETLLANGAFDLASMPDVLSRRGVAFTFESPLRQARGRADIARFQEAMQLTGLGAQLDPALADNFDAESAYRDALHGIGAAPAWLRDPRAVAGLRAARQKQQQLAQAAAMVSAGADVAGKVGDAAQRLRDGLGQA